MRKLINFFLYIIFIFFFTLISFEILLRFHPIYEKFGWKNKFPLFDRIEHIKKDNSKIKNVVIGDSLVEYMLGEDENFIEVTKKNLGEGYVEHNFYNLGFAGTGPRHYLMILNLLYNKDLNIDNIFIFIDNSTDFSDYFFDIESEKEYTKLWVMPQTINLDKENINIKNFIKKSVSINIIYRYVLKQYLKFDYGKSFNANLSSLSDIFQISNQEIKKRINKTDKSLIHLSNSDIINSFWAAGGIAFPEMKNLEKFGYQKHSNLINKLIKKDFNAIKNLCKKLNSKCTILFIPDQAAVDIRYQAFYKKLGYEIDETFLDGTSYYEDLIIHELNNSDIDTFRLHPLLKSEENMYLFLDNHFNYHGNSIMADIFTEIIQKKITSIKKVK